MSVFRRFLNTNLSPTDTPELALAQWRALSRQVPLMYIMLVANTLILAWTHLDAAPVELTVYIPAALTAICFLRTIIWWRSRERVMNPTRVRSQLRGIIWTGAAVALGFTAWSFSLFPYGDAHLQSQIAFYMGITTIGCMFCLMHVRVAALAVGICVLGPFTVFFSATGEETLVAIAVNMVLVVAVLLIILLSNSRDFADLVASRSAIARRQLETLRLGEENQRLANMDTLTDLPNRRSFDRHLATVLQEAELEGRRIVVGRLDLDGFKSINQIFGQLAGDRVLVEAARRIDSLRRADTFLARLESNTFGLILVEPIDRQTLVHAGEVLCGAMRLSFEQPEGVIRLTASAGFAVSEPGDTGDHLFDRADYALSAAKREQRGSAVIFSEVHAKEISKVRHMEHLLYSADLDDEIYVVLQPQYDVSLGATTGFEVLARWRSPVLGEISPAEFIPMAERTGRISNVTQSVLRKALAISRTLPPSIRLSVNLSANDIGSTTAIEQIAALFDRSRGHCQIDFEVTETAAMRDLKQANRSLLTLLGLGARIALDDFGTGHSSLTHVQQLPLHRIKIDRSFVAEVTNDLASRAIVKTMVDLCRNLGISCVFEGVETEEQLQALVALGGTVMQGYFFGRPMAVEEVGAYLRRERTPQRDGRVAG
ncbi:diguanylate cyclase (GGDEF)-like protein [Devosia subaequoris]|uniref:Diguanylate cyclase (GGDEF)-like protein n=1 Tax=Devosia subaequoris TaxID=395930 RepID=A0A7W6IK01_9HYPH|nr:EAL domain-containing protein [Devosia subaequoris]MBB4051023.1 diguanylate cyclase (GGDEF)-like protein [Devosia subaequoris]MCP1208309.1 EAL domain-containing protein [Devosia subaequoris]